MNTQRILVTGATGQQGGSTLRALVKSCRGWRLRALVRSTEAPAARALASQGIELVRGDLNIPASLDEALAGVDAVFAVQSPQEGGPQAEERQGKQLASAAAKAGIRHFVYSSAGGAERQSSIPHFESKWRIEEHIRSLGLPATVLRPAAFMENFATLAFRTIMLSMWKTFLPEDRTMQLVAVEDIGRFAARAFAEPDHYIGKSLELAGDAITRRQAVTVLATPGGCPQFPFVSRNSRTQSYRPSSSSCFGGWPRKGFKPTSLRSARRYPISQPSLAGQRAKPRASITTVCSWIGSKCSNNRAGANWPIV